MYQFRLWWTINQVVLGAVGMGIFAGPLTTAVADELTLANVTAPSPNAAAEPLADRFSLTAATRFLDQASLDWTKQRQCFTCHTNFLYLMSRPASQPLSAAHSEVRSALEELVEQRWPTKGPRWDAEVVMASAALALNDRSTSGEIHGTTRLALDRMWTVQQPDGGFDWLKCEWPPMESDDYYGAAVAILAAYSAPGNYAASEEVQQPLRKLAEYLRRTPPPTVHHSAMLMWADSYGAQTLSQEEQRLAIEELLSLQQPDGGWAIATLGDWQRADGSAQEMSQSDGYATGFVIYMLRRANVTAENPQLQLGLKWLRGHQRQSGRWYTRSLYKDSKHFISHAGTAFAVLALTACDP